MFTGIVEEVGTLASVRWAGNGLLIEVQASRVLDDLALGDSIALDGVCQTVTELRPNGFRVQAVATTLARTTFGDFASGRRVNLERSLRFGARVGGHLVQGHVDGVGIVESVTPQAELVLIDFTLPVSVWDVTVLHGSIALNGVSLTVNALPGDGMAQVSIIPYTWQHTALSDLRPGERVNLEGDMLGKYVRHLLGPPAHRGRSENPRNAPDLLQTRGYS